MFEKHIHANVLCVTNKISSRVILSRTALSTPSLREKLGLLNKKGDIWPRCTGIYVIKWVGDDATTTR